MSTRALRQLFSIIGCLALLAVAGIPLAPPAGAAVTPPANPNLAQACGLDFTLVLDRSGSVSSSGASTTVRNAAKAFLDALKDTGSTVSLTSFATSATVDQTATALTTANLSSLKAEVDALSFGDYTNWEDGLIKAQSTFAGFPGGAPKPDLVVVITDGNPNRYINDSNGSVQSSGGTATSLSEAVGKADAIKGAGTHLFALGVGGSSGLNTANLQAISGPDQWPATPFAQADWTSVTSFNDLQTALLSIATELCGGTVIVEKRLDGQPAAGWHFNATGGAAPSGGDTGANGLVSFGWDSALVQTTDITETPRPGYGYIGTSCTLNQNPIGSTITNGVRLNVGPLDTVRCVVNNRTLRTGIAIDKTASSAEVVAGGGVTYSYAVTNTGEVPLSDVSVSDDKCAPVTFTGGDTDHDGLLDLTETWTYGCAAAISVDTVNTATASGRPPVGPDVTASATATVDVVNPLLHVTKSGPASAHEGDTVAYTFTVANDGDVALTGLVVTDSVIGPIGNIDALAPGGSVVLTADYTIPLSQSADVTNTVVVCTTGPPPGAATSGGRLCDTDVHVLDVLHPAVTIDKSANPESVGTTGPITYSYVVKNTGDAALHALFVTDDILGPIGSIGSLAPGETVTMFKTVTVDASTPPTNIGTVVGTDVLGKTVTGSDAATITVVLGATITRPAPAAPPVQTAPAELPRTGAPLGVQTRTALALLEVGIVMTLAGRRRRAGRRAD